MSNQTSGARVCLLPADALAPHEPIPWLPEAYASLEGRGAVEATLATPSELIEVAAAHWPRASIAFIVLPDGDPCGFVAVEPRVIPPPATSLPSPTLSSRAERGISSSSSGEIPRSARDDRVDGRLTEDWNERSSRGECTIHALAIRRADRNLGYGVEAVSLVEDAEWATRVYAPIPRTNGLAIYFWLRAGYRPVRIEDDATRSRDPEHLWMTRNVALSGGIPVP